MSDRLRVLVTCPQMQRTIEHFRDELDAAGIDIELPDVVQALSEDELVPIIGRYDGMIAGDDQITAKVIDAASRLRTIAKWGVGVDGIDQSAAEARGIVVTNTPGAFGDEVADVALSYVLLLARRVHEIDRSVRDGGWAKPVGMTLAGKTLGVIGLGSIGRATVRRGVAFGMEVLGYDPFEPSRGAAADLGAAPVALDELLAQSRFVVVCCPLTPENHHLIDSAALALMSRDAFLVNVARGPLVDEAALADALARGAIAGAALDVFEVEPLPADSPLRRFGGVILGSHNGSNTAEGTLRVSGIAVRNLIGALGGVSAQ
jgi:D-3-phosphoglycerate dehydrogenase